MSFSNFDATLRNFTIDLKSFMNYLPDISYLISSRIFHKLKEHLFYKKAIVSEVIDFDNLHPWYSVMP